MVSFFTPIFDPPIWIGVLYWLWLQLADHPYPFTILQKLIKEINLCMLLIYIACHPKHEHNKDVQMMEYLAMFAFSVI